MTDVAVGVTVGEIGVTVGARDVGVCATRVVGVTVGLMGVREGERVDRDVAVGRMTLVAVGSVGADVLGIGVLGGAGRDGSGVSLGWGVTVGEEVAVGRDGRGVDVGFGGSVGVAGPGVGERVGTVWRCGFCPGIAQATRFTETSAKALPARTASSRLSHRRHRLVCT